MSLPHLKLAFEVSRIAIT
jgi:hypothetical protein